MEAFIEAHEPTIRLACFGAIFAAMVVWELAAPRRPLTQSRTVRWSGNLGLVVVNTVLVRLLFPVAAMGMAALATERSWGLMNYLGWDWTITVVVSVIALDLAIYVQHVLFHAIPVLWRLHRMHHADLNFDVTTGLRFHPIEIILSILIKMSVVVIVGPPVIAVLLFEVLLNGTSLFNHGNVRMPRALDNILRWIVVTPDMHRVHHSVVPSETNSNFGFNLPWWDRLFGTYRAQPAAGQIDMTIGIEVFRDPADQRIDHLLVQPFIGETGAYPINRSAGSGDTEDG